MGTNPNSMKNLIPAKKGDIRNPNGRPKKSFSLLNEQLKSEGYEALTRNQIIEAYSLIFSLDEAKIKEIATDKEQPLVIRLIIKELTNAETSGKAIQDMRNYVFGQAKQEITQNVTVVEQPLFPDIPKDEK